MPLRSVYSLLGVLIGFACVFPLLFKREKKPVRDAEFLLQQAQIQMRDAQAKNRARAVEVITQKNNLQALVDQTQKRVDRLTERAESVDPTVDGNVQRDFLAERGKLQISLAEMQAALATAVGAAEAVKIAMRREEEFVRLKVTEALVLKAQERQAQIEIAFAKSIMAETTNLGTGLFVQAREKVQHKAAQRDLIMQIAQTVETLNAAAEEADGEVSRQKLIETRDALRQSALNKALWKN